MNHAVTKARHGATLVEVMISALIVGALCVPAIHTFTYVATSYSRQSQRDRAFMLSKDLLSEINGTLFEDSDTTLRVFGLESDETSSDRSTYDDIDDYNGFSEESLTFRDGNLIDSADGFAREVTVQSIEIVNNKIERTNDATDLKLIVVTTTAPNEVEVSLNMIRSQNDDLASAGTDGQHRKHHVRIGIQTPSTWQWSSNNALNGLPEGSE